MGKLFTLTLVGILLAFLGERIIRFRERLQASRELDPIELPNCHLLEGIEAGSEDIDILPNGLAFISAGLRYPGLKSFAPDEPGEILLLDLNDENPVPVPLRISHGFDVNSFNPHGISTYIDQKGYTLKKAQAKTRWSDSITKVGSTAIGSPLLLSVHCMYIYSGHPGNQTTLGALQTQPVKLGTSSS